MRARLPRISTALIPPMVAALLGLAGCGAPDSVPSDTVAAPPNDSAFAAVQSRGAGVMGVDQYTSQHVFEDLPDGGRIVLERDDANDSAAVTAIRTHMREIASDFRAGDFTKPFAVHAREVPGTDVLRARRAALQYDVVDRPRGAEVRITTVDPAALQAVHAFLAFQRSDHRAAGHEGHGGHGGSGGHGKDSAR